MADKSSVVWVVDDDEAVRDSLRMLLRSVGIPAIAFASAREFLDNWHPDHPGCLVLDIRMPEMGGLELQAELARRGASIPIIFITGHGDVPMAVQAIQRGATHFLQKPFRDQDLLDAIDAALDSSAEKYDQARELDGLREHEASLTQREREVMQRVVDGQANKVIAIELGLSQRTVEIHRSRVMEKMGASSLADLVKRALALRGADG
ncbi:MAG: response regulator [Xanthomonadaceae bacterium]|nr:response regulator [Xanthomonadaceae bacterium]